MSKTNWDKTAQQEFNAMPADYRADWKDLRDKIMS
jgi:hypothetical protein